MNVLFVFVFYIGLCLFIRYGRNSMLLVLVGICLVVFLSSMCGLLCGSRCVVLVFVW